MSPNYDTPEPIITSPVYTGFWSPTLLTARKQTPRSLRAARIVAKDLGVKLVTSGSGRLTLTNFTDGIMVVQRYGVFIVTTTDIVTVKWHAVYKACVVNINDQHVILAEGATPSVTLPMCAKLRVRFSSIPTHHVPFVSSIRKCASEVLEPGMFLWYGTVSETKHVALLQGTGDGRLYCVSPGCNQSFSNLSEWKSHYSVGFHTPKFFRADFCDGVVVPKDVPLVQNCRKPVSIKSRIEEHGWEFRSINDRKHRKYMWRDICHKLGHAV